jgi:hypothetical protein
MFRPAALRAAGDAIELAAPAGIRIAADDLLPS